MHRGSRAEIVDFSSDDDNDSKSYCKHCLKFGFMVQLNNRIYPDNEPIPVDHENWLQCHECGEIVPIYETEKEATIKDVIETIDNPFESGKFHLETIPKRNSPAGKKASAKRRRNKIKLDDDPEIDTLLRVYGDRVNVLK